jgi:hypothetical protein
MFCTFGDFFFFSRNIKKYMIMISKKFWFVKEILIWCFSSLENELKAKQENLQKYKSFFSIFSKHDLVGTWSLDQISLDLFSRSKVSLKFGSRSKLFFGSRSKVLIIFDCFGTRSKVLIMEFLAFKTFDLVIKIASSFLALDQKF